MARVVVPGFPHHVTQRGNRRQATFFGQSDYHLYLNLMAQWCQRCGVAVWAYCLMPNHVHLLAVPATPEGLRGAIGEAHWRYTRAINFRQQWRGHLLQGRFASFVMDEPYLLAAARYVELNPVRARIVTTPEDYPWSSARAHLAGRNDRLVRVRPLLQMVGDWEALLGSGLPEGEGQALRQHERTDRPLGKENFINRLEGLVGKVLRRGKPGPRKGSGKKFPN